VGIVLCGVCIEDKLHYKHVIQKTHHTITLILIIFTHPKTSQNLHHETSHFIPSFIGISSHWSNISRSGKTYVPHPEGKNSLPNRELTSKSNQSTFRHIFILALALLFQGHSYAVRAQECGERVGVDADIGLEKYRSDQVL
jgi:hypothetical protein